MCKPASMVLTQHKVFSSKRTDAHAEIIREFELTESVAGKICLLKVEITPTGGDMSKPLADWQYRVDQEVDALPEWFDAAECEKRTRQHLADVWAKERLVLSGQVRTIQELECVFACGSSQVTAYGSSQVTACDSSQVTAIDSSHVTAYGSSRVTACGSSQVTAYDSSQVSAYDSSHVTACHGNATVSCYCKFSIKLTGVCAVVIDRTLSKAKCYVGTAKTRTIKIGGGK